ncbi:hypothetical protein F5X96DRAFT_87405 [Biscogniauxia mediterranea]|nr:hypothetical protein F5X96DRAFT_87405 [Biscogniauxia mediterranea]
MHKNLRGLFSFILIESSSGSGLSPIAIPKHCTQADRHGGQYKRQLLIEGKIDGKLDVACSFQAALAASNSLVVVLLLLPVTLLIHAYGNPFYKKKEPRNKRMATTMYSIR